MVGIPYAMQETDSASPSGFVKVCPKCGDRIPVIERKDFESFTGREYAEHYQTEHASEDQ